MEKVQNQNPYVCRTFHANYVTNIEPMSLVFYKIDKAVLEFL